MYVIAGLGNPGREYEGTRHNVGFMTLDALADKYNIDVREKAFKGLIGKGMIEGNKVILVKPQTYMNLSGECIRQVMDYYKVDPSEFIVIYDDISLVPGGIRIRKKGSAGGHNGIKISLPIWERRNFRACGSVWARSRRAWIWQTMCWDISERGNRNDDDGV